MSQNSKALQRLIAQGDHRSIENRWAYGRAVLADSKKWTSRGDQLRPGAIEALIADAAAVGSKLSESEIRRRIRCARAYKSLDEIRSLATDCPTWWDLVQAGFPAPKVHSPEPEQLALDDEPTEPAGYVQDALFPAALPDGGAIVPLHRAPLRRLVAYAAGQRQMTANFARRDAERTEHLEALITAAGGDLDVTYGQACELLRVLRGAAVA